MKIRRLNEDAKRFYVDEIVSAPGGKTETERHSFSTLDELKQYCKDASLTKDDIADCGGCDVKDLCEDIDKHTPDSRVKLEVQYEVYGRYGTGGQVKKGRVSGVDEVDALMKMLDHVHMYMDSDFADEFEEKNGTRPTTEDVIDRLYSENGDGCDLIYYITNLTTGNMIFDGGVVEEEEDWDNLDESADSKLHTKPNGEYLVKADSGKGYTAFSRDNVAIGGIDNEDADSDAKAIDKFKRNEYSECLNEEYFDTAEYRIQKYEDDIPELMAGMHDDYMEGKLAAEFYAEVLKKVYDALAECDHKHTMSAPVKTETNSQKVMNYLNSLDEEIEIKDTESLNEGSEKYYAAKYTAVDNSGNKTVKKICFRCNGTIEDAEKEVDAFIKEPYTELKVIGSCLKGVAEKDGYKLIESFENDVEGDDYGTPEDWEELESAETMDDAGEWCNLTLWKNISTGKYVIIIGDNNPWEGYSNMETFSEDEARSEFSAYLDEPMYNSDDYDDDYSDDYDESLEECSGIRAHKVIMGEGIDDIGLDGDLGEEGPTGDKTEDIEFVMEEYIAESLLIDFVEKVDALTYKVGANDQVVTVVFDPKWSEYVYTIDGKGPYSHSSYEFISRDIYDFVMSQIDASELDDIDD